VYLIGVVVLVVILALDVPGALVAYALGILVSASMSGVVMWREARRGPEAAARPGWNPGLVRSASRFGLRAYLASVVSFLNLRSDQFLVSFLAGTASLGLYSVAVTVAELMLFFPRALSTALLPRITAASQEDAGHLAASATRHTIGASVFGLLAIIPLALLIPLIFGEAYRPAVVPCLLLAPGVAAFSLAPVLSTYFTGQLGKPLIPSLLAALSLVVDLLLVLVLVPVLQLPGAALASTIAYLLTIAVMVALFLRVSHVPARDLYAFRAADLAAYRALLAPFIGRSRTREESG
jgi:O-antigen/teichoic acid export membrane protein